MNKEKEAVRIRLVVEESVHTEMYAFKGTASLPFSKLQGSWWMPLLLLTVVYIKNYHDFQSVIDSISLFSPHQISNLVWFLLFPY